MKKVSFVFLFIMLQKLSFSQKGTLDSLFASGDTTAVMDSLMKDFDLFLDSLTAPKSFLNISIGAGNGIFSFENKNSVYLSTERKIIFSPSIGYFHKSGLGLSTTGFMISDQGALNVYQFSVSPSYDLIRPSFSSGVSYTHYMNKDSVSFYLTPLQHELFAYFSYKKWWLRPSINFAYGWGSKASYEKIKRRLRAKLLTQLRRLGLNPGNLMIKNEESIQDFSLTVSLRKDFNWYNVLGKDDNIAFIPVLMLSSGTQNFGFNTSYSYQFRSVKINSLPSNQQLSDRSDFRPQSASLVLRGSYMKGKVLVQPQVLFDYYLPEGDDKFNMAFSITAGVSF
jgi:hypothetical protein